MRPTSIFVGFLALVSIASHNAPAAGPATTQGLTPVKTYAIKDLPEPEPGKNAWAAGNQWSYGIVLYDKWVYTASDAEYVLQFEADPATANLEYRSATPFGTHDPEKGFGINWLFIRRAANGDATLYCDYGSDGPHVLVWYAIDATTGKLSLRGTQLPTTAAMGLLTPDQNRMYNVHGTKIIWSRFAEDGAPIEDGTGQCKDVGHYAQYLLSPDGKQLYTLSDFAIRLDAYALDAKTGVPSSLQSLDLMPSLQRSGGMMPFSPDGRYLYSFDKSDEKNPGDQACILERNLTTGELKILSSGKTQPAFFGQGGPAWSRQSRFAFNADGTSGCFICLNGYYHRPTVVGTFACDPFTGALTVLATISSRGNAGAMNSCKLALDPEHGNLFTCGACISSFKNPANYAPRQ